MLSDVGVATCVCLICLLYLMQLCTVYCLSSMVYPSWPTHPPWQPSDHNICALPGNVIVQSLYTSDRWRNHAQPIAENLALIICPAWLQPCALPHLLPYVLPGLDLIQSQCSAGCCALPDCNAVQSLCPYWPPCCFWPDINTVPLMIPCCFLLDFSCVLCLLYAVLYLTSTLCCTQLYSAWLLCCTLPDLNSVLYPMCCTNCTLPDLYAVPCLTATICTSCLDSCALSHFTALPCLIHLFSLIL